MRIRILSCLSAGALLVATVIIAATSPASAAVTVLGTFADGAQEVPPNASTANGGIIISLDDTTLQVCIDGSGIDGLGAVTGSHIHEGAVGVEGPPVVDFVSSIDNCVPSTADVIGNIVANPAGFYVNLHTGAFPGGEIRGNLAVLDTTMLEIPVSGANESPPSGSTATGNVFIDITPVTHEICINALGVTGLDTVTGVHIHEGVAGVNGPPVVDFMGSLATCVVVDPTLIAEILGNEPGYYVNIHTTSFISGAVRGQLAQAPPPTTTTTAGTGSTTTTAGTGSTTTIATTANTAATAVTATPRFTG